MLYLVGNPESRFSRNAVLFTISGLELFPRFCVNVFCQILILLLLLDVIVVLHAYLNISDLKNIRASLSENRSSGFPTRSDINRAVQPQKTVSGLKF